MDIYFDFTCPYSRRTGRWWQELREEARWRPFLLREAHRDDDGPAEWERGDALDHVSVLALALHEAVDEVGGDVDAFRWRAMQLFEDGQVDGRALRGLASSVGGRDLGESIVDDGLRRVGQSHRDAVAMGVFGAPTFISDSGSAYLKLSEQPAPDRARAVYEATMAVLRRTPEVAEIKRPA